MMSKVRIFLLAAVAITSTSANAGLINVSEILIKSSAPTYLQVSEVVATETGTGNDLALSSLGAIAVGSSIWETASSPDKAIDGAGPLNHPNLFHSATSAASEFLKITLASVSELDSLTLFGRTDCCSFRDVYDVFLYDISGGLLFSGENYSAANQSHSVTIGLPDTSVSNTSVSVPEPGTLALFGLGLLGLSIRKHQNKKQTH